MDVIRSWPFPVAVAVLAVIGFLRANATYWLARAARNGAGHTRVQALFGSVGYTRAERLVARWGAPAVTLCFLTVGVQTMINLAAGATRMPLRSYLPAVGLGSLIWGTLYATVGAVTWQAVRALYAYDPVLTFVLAGLVGAAVVTFVVLRIRAHRSRRAAPAIS